jgi:DNA repair exonuclease SbcCD ATPase subunit
VANEHIIETLGRHYPELQRVSESVFRGVDFYDGRPYAIRYFDVGADPISVALNLSEYQDKLLGADYFNTDRADLRWNHYLYFVTSTTLSGDAFQKAKTAIELDREYARKFVISEGELDAILADPVFGAGLTANLPPDPLSIWTRVLEQHELGFIVDESLQVPTIVRHIADGESHPLLRAPAAPQIGDAERAVSDDFLATLRINQFRKYPIRRTFSFGLVNLILGVNGVGKTSLLEAIEYVFCGKTRRGGSFDPRSSVSAALARSNLTLQTGATTAPATLRGRHLAWYGKSELRRLTLDDSFSKFNFLDTDAAVRLTVESSRERISEDLTQLLLGAEAAKALDRFDRVAKQLQDSRKALENDISLREYRRTESAARLQQLRETPRESDQLFADLLQDLDSVGWKRRPVAKDGVNSVSASVQAAIVNIAVLRSHRVTGVGEIDSIDSVVALLTDAEQTVAELVDADGAHRKEGVRANTRLNDLTRRIEAMDEFLPMVAAGVIENHQRLETLEREAGEIERTLSEAEAAVTDLPSDKALHQLPLSKAVREWTEQIQRTDKTIGDAKKQLAALERAQSILVSLQQRLRSSAREIIQHTHDGTHCPLCGTEYAEDELEKRLNDATHGLVRDESEHIRAQLQTAETARRQLVAQLRALQVLQRYINTDKAKASVETAVRAVSASREQLAKLQAELDGRRNTLQMHLNRGWTFGRLVELSTIAGIPEPLSADSIERARAAARSEQKTVIEALKKLETEAARIHARLSEVGLRFGVEDASAADLLGLIVSQKRAAEEQRDALKELRTHLDLPQGAISEIEARLREAQEVAVRLKTALAKEAQHADYISRESKLLDDAVAEIAGLHVRLKRIDSAEAVIQDLLNHHSERVLADTVLRENASRIASTFAKIHAPNEFELVVHDGLRIMRRGGGPVELEEMSSGQRAAYALSLFLAMNERLRTGPKVILFDDPVAHVDDINTLSLLDHLRDIALSGQRQIFFATADSKIGGLFGRKFRFLGDEFKQIELSRDDAL